MTTDQKVELLIQQAADLPDDAQEDLFLSLVQMRSQHLGIDNTDHEIDAPLV